MSDSEFQHLMHRKAVANCRYLSRNLTGRDAETRLVLLAALSGQHSLLIGMPGTGKSLLAAGLHKVFQLTHWKNGQPRTFQTLMMRFTKPDEVFGPLDIPALLSSRQRRELEGFMPLAEICFLDEIFKANPAILNSLLTILNERQFRNGDELIGNLPLIAVVAASNELPRSTADAASDALTALFDRFLVRVWVDNLGSEFVQPLFQRYLDSAFDPCLNAECEDPNLAGDVIAPEPITIEELRRARKAASTVLLPYPILNVLMQLRTKFHQYSEEVAKSCAGGETSRPPFYVSDRRWNWILKFLQVAAWYDDRDFVGVQDLALLPAITACDQADILQIRRLCGDFAPLLKDFRSDTPVPDRCLEMLQATNRRLDETPSRQWTRTQHDCRHSCLRTAGVLEQLCHVSQRKAEGLSSIWVRPSDYRTTLFEKASAASKTALEQVIALLKNETYRQALQKLESPSESAGQSTTADILQVITVRGMSLVLVNPVRDDSERWRIESLPGRFYLSASVVSNSQWHSLMGSGPRDEKPAVGKGLDEILKFLTRCTEVVSAEVRQQGIAVDACRLPTVDEWRAALQSVCPRNSAEGLISDAGKVNCQSSGASVQLAVCTDTRFDRGPKPSAFNSLLGNCWQRCMDGQGQSLFVGGHHTKSLEVCISTISKPEECAKKVEHNAGFRVAFPVI